VEAELWLFLLPELRGQVMGFVNALINQVGREMGRDLYWTARSSFSGGATMKGTRASDQNTELTRHIQKRKWSSRARPELLEEDIQETIALSEHEVDVSLSNWTTVYEVIDDRIDELKLTANDAHLVQLQRLEAANYNAFMRSMEAHKSLIQSRINQLEANLTQAPPSGSKVVLLSFAGLASGTLKRHAANRVAELIGMGMVYVLIFQLFLPLKYVEFNEYRIYLSLFGIVLYLLLLIGHFVSLNELRKQQQGIQLQSQELRSYLQRLP
jgi:hypothetical protein